MSNFDNWETLLPEFPKWNLGGEVELEESDEDSYELTVNGAGRNELEQYKQLLKQSGFATSTPKASDSQLYKNVGGATYNFDSEEPFMGGANSLSVFLRKE
jgi:hypothetical protein